MRHHPRKLMMISLVFFLSGCFAASSSLSTSFSSATTSVTTSVTNTSSVGSTTTSQPPTSVTPATVTISFEENGGTPVADLVTTVGAVISAPTPPTRAGYTFLGWFTDVELTQAYVFTVAPANNLTLYAKWAVDIYDGAVTVSAFKSGTLETYAEVVGVVLFAHEDMGLVIITDATGLLAVISENPLLRGDLVRMGGYRTDFEGLMVMADTILINLLVDTYAHDQAIPLDPVDYSLVDFVGLDPLIPNHWIQYFSLHGLLVETEDGLALVDGDAMVPLLAISMEDYQWAMMHTGFEVRVNGIVVPNFDDVPSLMFIFIGGENNLTFNYTDEGLLEVMLGYLKMYLERMTYYPGQTIDLPSSHPFLPMEVSYQALGVNASQIDLETGLISESITEPIAIDLIATGTYLTLTDTIAITILVAPIVITPIATFRALPDDIETFYFIEAVVVFIQLEHQFAMVADATGLLFIMTNDSTLQVGDRIVAFGVKMTIEGMVILANEPTSTVIKTLDTNQVMPLAPTVLTLEAFSLLDPLDPNQSWRYVEVTGTLMYDSVNQLFYLSDGTINLPLFVQDSTAIDLLTPYINQEVVLRAMSLRPGEEIFLILVFLNFPDDIVLMPT